MPWFVLAAAFAAIYARLLRANLIEVLGEDYIRTARAKGLSERRVIFRHGVRSAITPIVTVLGLDIGILLGGAILTETVFNIPGIGRLAYDAIQRGDLITVQGTDAVRRPSSSSCNLIVDILYAFLDPRVRLHERAGRCWRSTTCASTSTPRTAWSRPSTASPTTSSAGTTLGIVGESGSGKSVSSLTVMGLTRSQRADITGEVRFDGKDLLQAVGRRDAHDPRRRDRDDLPGPAVVAASLLQGRRPARRGGPAHRNVSKAQALDKRAVEMLRLVGIPRAARTASAPTRTSSPAACASAR